jgi:hypothetical protein
MYRVGFIDDQPNAFTKYRKKILRFYPDVELVLLEDCFTKEQFLNKIYEERVEVLLVDYKMAKTFGFNGSTLINFINDEMRDLECFIMTEVDQQEANDGLVPSRNIISKTIFDTEGEDEQRVNALKIFVETLKDSADVFHNRSEQKKAQYLELFEKRKGGLLSLEDEEEYLRLYKVLSSYGMIEKLPQEVLTKQFEKDLNELIRQGTQILEKAKSRGE